MSDSKSNASPVPTSPQPAKHPVNPAAEPAAVPGPQPPADQQSEHATGPGSSTSAPHPASGHRTPSEIDKDETGPVGSAATQGEPMRPLSETENAPRQEDEHIHDAVQRSAHAPDASLPHSPEDKVPAKTSNGDRDSSE